MKSSGYSVVYLRCIEPASEEYGSWFEIVWYDAVL